MNRLVASPLDVAKRAAVASVAILLCASVAFEAITISGGTSLGKIVLASVLPSFILIVLVFAIKGDYHQAAALLKRPGLSMAHIASLLVISPIVALAATSLGSAWGMTYWLMCVATAGSVFMAFFLTLVWNGVWGLAILLPTLPFIQFLESTRDLPWYHDTIWDLPPVVLTPSFTVLLLFLVASLIRNANPRHLASPVNKYLIALAVFLVLPSATSPDPASSLQAAIPYSLLIPLVYLVTITRVRSYAQVRVAFIALAAYAFLRLAMIFYFFASMQGWQLDPSQSLHDSMTTLAISPVVEILPTLTLWAGPMLASLAVAVRFWPARLLAGVLALVSFILLFASGERSTLVGLASTLPLVVILPRSSTKHRLMLGITLLALIVPAIFVSLPVLEYRLGTYTSFSAILSDMPVYQRVDAWVTAIRMMLDHPLGVGFGGFPRLAPSYPSLSIVLRSNLPVMPTPHNWYLDYGVNGGWGALISLLGLLALVVRTMIHLCRNLADTTARFLAVGLTWSFFAFLVAAFPEGIVDFLLWQRIPTVELGLMYWVTIGLCISLFRIHRAKELTPDPA